MLSLTREPKCFLLTMKLTLLSRFRSFIHSFIRSKISSYSRFIPVYSATSQVSITQHKSMTAKDADREDKRGKPVFTLRRESDSGSAVRVLEQPGFGTGRWSICPRFLGLCSDVRLDSLRIQHDSSHLDQNNKHDGQLANHSPLLRQVPQNHIHTSASCCQNKSMASDRSFDPTGLTSKSHCFKHLSCSLNLQQEPDNKSEFISLIFDLILLFFPSPIRRRCQEIYFVGCVFVVFKNLCAECFND